jgi:hypothetical protein
MKAPPRPPSRFGTRVIATMETEPTMRTSTKKKLSATTETVDTQTAQSTPPTAPAPSAAQAGQPAQSTPATGAVSPIALPPANAYIPSRPKGWVPRPGEDYRGLQPKAGELTNIESAIEDLRRFTDYTKVLGTAAPGQDHVIQLLQACAAWSSMRAATEEWDVYSQAQEGLSWTALRLVMPLLRKSFDVGLANDGNLATQLPSLVSFLDAQKVIARKGASARVANSAEIAAGNPPSHGKAGKARQRAAQKAALEAQSASPPPKPEKPATPTSTSTSTPTPTATPTATPTN